MPLSQVHKGMTCTAYSVFSGTEIEGFTASVVDVIAGDAGAQAPAILIRLSGSRIEATGAGNGFSGSPIYCPDANGVQRNIGAISQGIGQYGNTELLATPIESMLGQPVVPPSDARRDPALRRRARNLSEPLTITGVSAPLQGYLTRAAARSGRALYFAPSRPLYTFPPQTLRPGAAVAVGLASGDVTAGAIGTVSYTDGNRVWAFGHPLDSAGRRSLLLEDAYVYDVINNPLGLSEAATTYKLAAPGHDLGTLTGDGASAVTGVLGALPPRIALHVLALRPDTGRHLSLNVQVADERDVGLPAGSSALATIAPIAISEAAASILGGTPPRHSGSLCLNIHVRERARPVGFCNTYVNAGGSPAGVLDTTMLADVSQAMGVLDSYQLAPLHITGVEGNLQFVPAVRQGVLLGARALGPVRRGGRVRVALTLQRPLGPRHTRTITVPIPRGARPGLDQVTLSGTAADSAPSSAPTTTVTLGSPGATPPANANSASADQGPASPDELAHQIATIHRYDGVTAVLVDGHKRGVRRVYRDPNLRISGSASFSVRVRR
jgi:hypothetical protein